ncbi:uncharacterized protein UV8b_00186 [Ustilaginoidea virens]|uniref:Uncharacterized protein n=1 Tax=Ustilaginoidea virens TaxID=1159556 RepID=A0A8E5HIK3_USTVR|nr:uncharacterized protein UV8b_00186 [Ustilaginoidea virens]QUC15945.1 hypothetical protein UV8b_00186 [Ustilaginoidea virens]
MPAREILFKIPEKCHISTPNLLPCHIHHDGMVDPVEGLWKPHATSDGPKVTYLRGRKLIGKELPLPDQYTGVLVRSEPAATSSNDTISTPNREKSATGVEFPSDEAVKNGFTRLRRFTRISCFSRVQDLSTTLHDACITSCSAILPRSDFNTVSGVQRRTHYEERVVDSNAELKLCVSFAPKDMEGILPTLLPLRKSHHLLICSAPSHFPC